MKFRLDILTLISAATLSLSIVVRYNFDYRILELLGSFGHFLVVISIITCLLSAMNRLLFSTILSSVTIIISWGLVSSGFEKSDLTDLPADLSILQANFYHYNPESQRAINLLSSQDFDIISLQELNSKWSADINSELNETYPYHIESQSDTCCYGIGLFSKFPIEQKRIITLENTPCIEADINVHGRLMKVISLHTRPPIFPNETEQRNRQLSVVAKMASDSKYPCLVLGDFNVVPWDPVYISFLNQSNQSSMQCGFQPTYPMDFGIPLIPIDHITYSNELALTNCGSQEIPGSDHRAIYASFRWKE